MLTALGIVSMIFSRQIIGSFQKDDFEVMNIGCRALRFHLMTLPIQACVIMVNMLVQSIGYGFRASVVSMGRQGLFFIPLLIVLPRMIGILGIQIAQPISDVFTFLLALCIVIPILRELKKESVKNEAT